MKLRYEFPFRPAYEVAATGVWCVGGLLGMTALRDWSQLPVEPIAVASTVAGAMTIVRGQQAVRLLRRRRRLKGRKPEKITLAALRERVEGMGDDGLVWLGSGFQWEQHHAQMAFDALRTDRQRFMPKSEGIGSRWIHGLNDGEGEIVKRLKELNAHMLIVGTTGAGKTRLADLIVAQAVLRGECVIIIDPKGDKELAENARRVCEALGQPEKFVYFHPAFPEKSVRINPLANFQRPSELASRVAGVMPIASGSGQSFQAYCQDALNNIIQGLLLIGERPTLVKVRSHLEGAMDELAFRAVEAYAASLGLDWQTESEPFIKATPHADKNARARAFAMTRYYRETIMPTAPLPDLDGLLGMVEHDRAHHGKMIASLKPVLGQLTSGVLGPMLSPDPRAISDQRPITDLKRIIDRGQVLYLGLDALSDGMVASSIGSLMLADLASVAGARYNFGKNLKPVNLLVDEAAETTNPPLIQILNKGRGALIRAALMTQTVADFEVRLGGAAQARQVLGNVNTILALRIEDTEAQEFVSVKLGDTMVEMLERAQGMSSGSSSSNPLEFSGTASERTKATETGLFPPQLFGQLPDLEFLMISGGEAWKGRLPILEG